MTDRKWRVVSATNRKEFYQKIEKYENMGYELLPESFNRGSSRHMHCLMKKKDVD